MCINLWENCRWSCNLVFVVGERYVGNLCKSLMNSQFRGLGVDGVSFYTRMGDLVRLELVEAFEVVVHFVGWGVGLGFKLST